MLKNTENFRAAIATLWGNSAQTVLANKIGIIPRAVRAWFERDRIPPYAWDIINKETDNRIQELKTLKNELNKRE